MRIREVELVGFKSFVDKTRFLFNDRITAVVGPNGCGKSNIVDAIKWVMGELSAKSLRGDSMEDVIFNGSDERKPLSLAQVSLIFSTEDGMVPPGYEMYENIEITRRLYRSGESEYLVNKQPARLKDIQELLMDTGLGAKAYSIVEQGEISRVISARPEDRRHLIEEAAGITKFRVKKEEALRKVERTLADLDRVQDVVSEIKRQMNSLARQASKALRFKEVREELMQVDLEQAARQHKRLAVRQADLEQDITRMNATRDGTKNAIDTGENELSASHLALAQMQGKVEQARRDLAATNEEIRTAENERNVLARDVENEAAKARTFQEEIVRASERIALLETTAEKDDDQAATLSDGVADRQQRLDELIQNQKDERKLLALKGVDADQVRGRQVELVTDVTKLKSAVEGWNDRRAELLDRSEGLKTKSAQAAERIAGLGDRIAALHLRRDERKKEIKDLSEKLLDKQNKLGALREQMNLQRERYEQAREHHQQMSVRLNSLTDMKRNMEGYREGVRNILLATAKQNEAGGSVQGVLGVVADLIEVPESLESAFEAVLGERLQAVVVEDLKAGMKAADFLKTEKSGRSSFVPLKPKRDQYTGYPGATRDASEGPLLDFVGFDKRYEPVVRHLLDGVLVVEDLDKAERLHKANGYRGAFVTREGEILDPHGVITGGDRQALNSGILQMKREIDNLCAKAGELETAHNNTRDVFLRSEGMIATQEVSMSALSRKIDELGLDLRELDSEIQRSENERNQLGESEMEFRSQIEAIAHLVEQGQSEHASRSKTLTEQSRELELVQMALTESEAGTREISARIDALGADITALSAELSSERERAAAATQRAEAARQGAVEARERIARLQDQIGQCEQNGQACREKIAELEKQIEARITQAEQKAVFEAKTREELDAFVESVRLKEEGLKTLRRDLDGIIGQVAELEKTAMEVKLTHDNLTAQVQEKYNVDLVSLAKEYGESEIDNEALRTRQEVLSKRLRAMGDVNLAAIEEHDEAKKRYEFYMEQQNDLLTSIDNLRKAISKINKESRERFATTFAAVASKFSDVLPVLFGGGTAKLSLTESNDILDAGVEVHVRPPGKKLQTMSLMSGGEKALAAIGLLFSVFLIKPSPFCLMDEVDAPLDDANIHRFVSLVEQMSGHSQIILITHNKRTMEKADALYGVTMQEKGVSKLVSVRLANIPQGEA